MNSSKCGQIITNIKMDVEEKNRRRYMNLKQQKNIQFYTMYKDKVVYIQKWWRGYLTKRNLKLERKVMQSLEKQDWLERVNKQKKEQLEYLHQKRSKMIANKENQCLNQIQNQITAKLKRVFNGTIVCAQKLAQNNGKAKFVFEQIQTNRDKCQELQAQIQALQFQIQCHMKRKSEWQQKLMKMKQNVFNESLKARQIKNKIIQLQNSKLNETMASKISNMFNSQT